MRRLWFGPLGLAVAFACGGPHVEPASAGLAIAPDQAGRTKPLPVVAQAPPIEPPSPLPVERPGCPQEQVIRASLELNTVHRIADVAGRTWVVAEGPKGRALLLHLDSAGGLVQTPLPWWSERVAIEGGDAPGLRFIDAATPRWFRVDLGDPRRPKVGPVRSIPGLTPGQYPKAVASDGRRALVSLYRRATEPGKGGPRYLGETFFLDVLTGAKIGDSAPATLWMARCAAGRCFGLAELNRAPQPNMLVEIDDAGLREIQELGAWDCSGAVEWREGDEWWIARNERGRVALSVLDLSSGRLRQESVEVGGECSEVQPIALPEGHGLVIHGRQLIRIGEAGEGAKLVPLPQKQSTERLVVGAEGWILATDFDSASWMQHDPPDVNGEYEYTEHFSFKGQAGLLELEGARWRWKSVADLPHSGEEGDYGNGYRPLVMSAPGQAGVLLVNDMGPSEYIALVEPC